MKDISIKENERRVDTVAALRFNSVITLFYDVFTCVIKCELIEWLITDPIEKFTDMKSVLLTGTFGTIPDPAFFMNLSF
jgi:hypothetical protein